MKQEIRPINETVLIVGGPQHGRRKKVRKERGEYPSRIRLFDPIPINYAPVSKNLKISVYRLEILGANQLGLPVYVHDILSLEEALCTLLDYDYVFVGSRQDQFMKSKGR